MINPGVSVSSHINELKKRLLWLIAAVIVTTMISFYFHEEIIEFLLLPAEGLTEIPGRLVFIEVTEMLGVIMKVSFMSGFVLVFPLFLYQAIRFASPGLTRREKVFLAFLIPGVLVTFFIGSAFSYFIVIPNALNFLINFGSDIAQPNIRISNYVNTVLMLLFWMGIVFQTPVVMVVLSKMGVVRPARYAGFRRFWVVIAFVMAAVITPTLDPINQCLVAAPLIVLFEVGYWISKLLTRKKREKLSKTEVDLS